MIEVRELVASRGGTRVLDGLDLTIDDGEFVLLVGPNGAGKTTLVRQFNGLEEPDSGEVLIDGRPVQDDLVAARTAVGMVFQDPRDQFVAATVSADVAFGPENLGLSHDEIDRRVTEALETVGMDGRGEERVDRLSGGEQARVAIAGALAMAPDHLVLDEPLASLDLPARRAVCDRLASLHENGTGIVLVTHDLRDVTDLADRIVVLSGGRVALDGDPDTVRDRLESYDVRPC
ncbi:ABC transporter ATP-binding protein [Halorientalis sp. IM1011]|uniref:energy-coupling factor ABC transporter ATP-binding protein n=1 Tax=Halorientalis sp. IM1011 TaxID=1932360 RepID=UPI00097CC33C|nr:ABC transporter ATP-binding protein [Halorientalis sp. IM1011]AQL42752.1 ABC transporter ATP-binding protein [Halorientalis sp. IM1011]